MAILKQRIKKKNNSGTYDTLHIETNSNLVLMDNGNTVQYEMYNHTHTKNQITNFPTSMAPTSHTHPKSQITDFPSSMPPDYHTHSTGDIWNFPSTMAPSWHQHNASDILNLPSGGIQMTSGNYTGNTRGYDTETRTINIGVNAKLCIVYTNFTYNNNEVSRSCFITHAMGICINGIRTSYSTTGYVYTNIKISGSNIIVNGYLNQSDYTFNYIAYY